MIQLVVDVEELQALVRQGGVLLDVLPEEDYLQEHIAGAINLPLKTLDRTTAARLPRDRAIVAYCDDFQ